MRSPSRFDLEGARVFVAGHRGMVGSAIARRMSAAGAVVLTVERADLDLTRQIAVETWMRAHRPDVVVVAAAKVGGIHANNTYPVDFLLHNLQIETNLFEASHATNVKKLLFLGSSCIYPRLAPQPMKEEVLLTGALEPTNQWYAIAKIAGIKLCQAFRRQYGRDYISLMPTNLYGPGDNYHPLDSHVPAALIRRFHEAKRDRRSAVVVWGSGKPRREFLFVDDLADACVFALEWYSADEFLNIGTGEDIPIAEFATMVADVVGYTGRIVQDTRMPDGAPVKRLDVSRVTELGWRAKVPLRAGLEATYADFLAGGGRNVDVVVD